MRINTRWLVIVGLAMTLIVGGLTATPAFAVAYPSATAMLQAYYSDINLRDYQTAYGMWAKPVQTYQNFVNGYTDTVQVDPYFGNFQQGTNSPVTGRIPTVLVGYHTDGTFVAFFGCLYVRYTGSATLNWVIDGANVRALGNLYPDYQTISGYTQINCFSDISTVKLPVMGRTFTNEQNMLTTYYRLVNARDYNTAYTYWLHPLPGPKPNGAPATDYRQTLVQFATGYKDTTFVSLYMGEFNQTGASAGHSYLDGLLPAVLVGQHTDGSVVTYYGCYVIGGQDGLPYGNLGIVSGAFKLLGNDVPNAQMIAQYLNIDCTTLNLQF
ncbi:MAG: hypothetical protein KF716_29610 [Anaerolineae bacterium]|nr:hypothetical protein [Anaerolineae bacterium]